MQELIDKLIACPHCGNEAQLKFWEFSGAVYVECRECTKVFDVPIKETVH